MGQQESGQGDGLANSEKNLAHLDKLKEALDSSSDKNRNFLIVFLLLEFYIFIAVLGTTDLNLFLASSFYTFPFIQFQISLEQFYLVAPFLLLAFHFNLVFNFLEHCKILRAWSDEINRVGEKRAEQLSLLRAFIINTRAKYDRAFDVNGNSNDEAKAKQKRKADYLVLNSIFVSFVFVFPLVLQVFILWKFAAFQSILYTGLHVLTVGLSIGLLCWYWPGIQNPNLIELEGQEQTSKVQRTFSNKTSYLWLFGWIFLAFVFASVRAYYTWQYYKATDEKPQVFASWIKPTLSIEDKDIKVLANNAIERTIESAQYQSAREELTTAKIDFTEILHCKNNEQYQEIVLKDRSFKGINLKEVVICNVSLKQADLTFAHIEQSVFSGQFKEATFNHSTLEDVHFQMNSDFEKVAFIDVDASRVIANKTRFVAADFTKSNILSSEFNGSSFTGGVLAQVLFTNSKMFNTDFFDAKSFNASMSLATADFAGCKLMDTAITNDEVDFGKCEVTVTPKKNDNLQIGQTSKQTDKNQEKITNNDSTTTTAQQFPQEVLDRIAAVKASNGVEIDLDGFGLTQLPSELLALSQLKRVNLGDNKLDHKQMRLLINAMPNLERLDWYSNQLTQLPVEIVNLKQLQWLDIGFNPFNDAQKEIDKLARLERLGILFLYGLSLEFLPPSFSRLTNLIILSLSYNNFVQVPEQVWQLTELEALYLYNNKLTSLSADIGKLTKLSTLRIENNQLETLPRELANLPITGFDATNNPLTSPPQAIADASSGYRNFDKLQQWFAKKTDN